MNGADLADHFKAALEGRAPSLPRVAGLDVERRYIIRHHELAALVEAALAKPASSPAGGDVLEAVLAALRQAASGGASGLAGHEIEEIANDLLAALSPSTSAAEPVAWIANCCRCGRIVDTREEKEGGDEFGCEMSDGRWTCSPECWDAVVEPDATPPAPAADGQRVKDGRPEGWTEALAISFMAANGHNPEMGMFAKSFNEGAWRKIKDEWPEFVEFVSVHIRACLATDKEGA